MPALRLPGDSKPIWQSKTFWANAITAVGTALVALIDTELIQDNPGWVAAIVVVVNVLNILLRLVSDKPVTLGVVLLALSLSIASAAVATDPVAPAPNTTTARFAAEVTGKTPTMAEYMHGVAMKHRAANGRHEQRLDDDCTRIAQNWANWMAANNTMRHGGGENIIAFGTTTPEATMQMWIKSPGHRFWMLSNTTRAGWGCQRSSNGTWYWAGAFRNDPPPSKANVAAAKAR